MQTSVIYQGDNLKVLPELPDSSVDLVYIDPPFNSGREYEVIWKEKQETRSFDDRYGNLDKYIEWLQPRAEHLVRVLKDTGTFFFHCDTHANYRIRVLLQDVLQLNFLSEIVWKRTSAHPGTKRPGPVHDTVLMFGKSRKYTWNPIYVDYEQSYIDEFFDQVDAQGKRYKRTDLTGAGTRNGDTGLAWRGIDITKKGRHWARPPAELEELDATGRIHWPAKKGGMPRLKQYPEDLPGVPLSDVWTDIPPLHNLAAERIGYPTQKPLALMTRILEMCSNEGDVVLDAFCGCGTSLVAAGALKRKWIGIDVSPTACNVVADRLWRDLSMRKDRHFWIASKEEDIHTLRKMEPWDFQNWTLIALGGRPNRKKGADKGIDGRLVLFDPKAPLEVQRALTFGAITGKQGDIFEKVVPVQVKQKDKAGRIDVDNFETALRREKCNMGILVAFDFTKDAREEVERVQREEGVIIHLFTVEKLLEMQAA